MSNIRLVCWNEELARDHARELKAEGIIVDASPLRPSGVVSNFRDKSLILIDLDRLPSHGREVAVALRNSKNTRHIPIVFAGGEPPKVEKIRKELPDAVYTGWKKAAAAVKKALKTPVINPVRPAAHMERWAGSSLHTKLGVKPEMTVALLGAPDGFSEKLGDPAQVVPSLSPKSALAIWFVRSRLELEREIEFLAARLPLGAALWIVLPKQSGQYRSDFTQNDVRARGLECGLVDYKVCAVDADWYGMKFARKKINK